MAKANRRKAVQAARLRGRDSGAGGGSGEKKGEKKAALGAPPTKPSGKRRHAETTVAEEPLAKRRPAAGATNVSEGLRQLGKRLSKEVRALAAGQAWATGIVNDFFFELANAPEVSVEVTPTGDTVVIRQDLSPDLEHSGGIVWETSYVLARYMMDVLAAEEEAVGERSQTLLELGAGCGYLSIALRHCFDRRWRRVVATEQGSAFENLKENVQRNAAKGLRAKVLDWTDREARSALGTFDIIVATDVIFSLEMVLPLAKTMRACSSASTVIYLLVQEREAAAHAKFLAVARRDFADVEPVPIQLSDPAMQRCAELQECLLFRLSAKKEEGD